MCRSLSSPILALPLLFFFAFLTTSFSLNPSLPLPTHLIYQFPNETWVENLALRSNGEILVTLQLIPAVYVINTVQRSAVLVHSFPGVAGLLGITEVEHDVFYTAVGNLSAPTRPSSFSIWEIDVRSFSLSSGARVRKVTDTPDAIGPNGLVTLSKADHTILFADCILGAVWKLNVKTGAHSITISDLTMTPVATANPQIGINGVKIRDGWLYFTSTNQGLLCRVPISNSGNATGAVEVLATGLAPDDFVLDGEDRPWIAQNVANVVSVQLENGTVVNVVGAIDQLTVAGPTSCAFGRLRGDEDLLYCTTTGGVAAPVNGTAIEGGKVVAIDSRGF